MKVAILLALRIFAMTVIYFVCFAAVSAALLSTALKQTAPPPAGSGLATLLAVSFLNTIVLSWVILRSRWAGWKLILAIFFITYSVATVMGQIETAFFVTGLPAGMLPRLFLSGAIFAAIFSVLAVLILGKRKPDSPQSKRHRLDSSPRAWLAKLLLIVICYLVIYFSFGYYIAWKSEAVRAYYGGSDPGSLLAQISSVLRDTPLLLPLQAVRALLWTAIAIPVIKMMKGPWWEAAIAVALLFSVVMNSQLLLPNPFMPQEVRMVHLLETATSNFLFGFVVVVILAGRHQHPRVSV